MTKEEMIARISQAIEKAGASPSAIATVVVEELEREEVKPFPQDGDRYYFLNTVGGGVSDKRSVA